MGHQLVAIFNQVKNKYGTIGVYRLIVKTKVTTDTAKDLEDSQENIELLRNAANELGLVISTDVVSKRKRILSRIFRRG